MNPRLAAAVAALSVVALIVFGPAVAQAAPPAGPLTKAPGPLCTVQEWADPSNFKRCTEAAYAATQATIQ